MTYSITPTSAYSGTAPAATSENVAVDDSFIEMLTEKFLNDDIPDAYQDQYGKPLGELSKVMLGVETGDVITLDDLNASIKRDFSGFKGMLDQALEAAGIAKDPSFEVNMGGSGRLYIDSEHPDKEAIEKILNETRNIRDTFARMSANSSLLAAGKRAVAFNKAYELDPESAVRQYSYLFNEKPCDIFSIFVGEDGYKPSLTSYGEKMELDVLNELIQENYSQAEAEAE